MAKRRKTWREKLEDTPDLPKIVDLTQENKRTNWGTGIMLVPRPLDIDALVRKVGEGKLITQDQIREKLARDSGVDFTCPLTTGIFLGIIANAAEEGLEGGAQEVAPYWRVIKADSSLNPKFPGGAEAQAARLEAEGHAIQPGKGKKPPRVADFEKAIAPL